MKTGRLSYTVGEVGERRTLRRNVTALSAIIGRPGPRPRQRPSRRARMAGAAGAGAYPMIAGMDPRIAAVEIGTWRHRRDPGGHLEPLSEGEANVRSITIAERRASQGLAEA